VKEIAQVELKAGDETVMLSTVDWEAIDAGERISMLLSGKVKFMTAEGDVIPMMEVLEALKQKRNSQ